MSQTTSVSPPPVRRMASPSPYYSSAHDQSSLFVSESPSPQRSRPPNHQNWDSRPAAPPRNPSFALPPLTPSLLNNNRSLTEGDPCAVYRNQGQNTWNYFSTGASGGNANATSTSRQPQHQRQNHPNPQPQPPRGDDYFYIPSITPRVRQNQSLEPEPQLPTPQPHQQNQGQGQLTPSRFELPDGENYLTSTPDGGWNIADYSDAFDPSALNDPSNYNGNLGQEDPFNSNWHSNQENAEPEPRVLDQEGQGQLYQDPDRTLGAQARDRDQQILQGEEQNRQYDEWEREARERERVQHERRGRALRDIQRVQLEREREERARERERDNEVDVTDTSPIANMPRGISGSGLGGRKRTAARAQSSGGNDGGAISPPPAKRSKTNATSASQQSRNNDADRSLEDDLFGTPPPAEDEVDLVNVNDDKDYEAQKEKRKAEELKRQREEEAARPLKLAKQQCVICLDQPTGLVATHCGHMFCGECLHGALNAANAMGNRHCPVCRQKIAAPKADGKMPKGGYFFMQMKLGSRKGKGKSVAKG